MQVFIILHLIFHFLLQSNITGRVVYVSDGDTFNLIMLTGHKLKIRVEGIDAPEMVQEFGLEAKEFAVNEIHGRIVRLQVINTDRYGRKVARVFYDKEKDLGKELLKKGLAWHYIAYNKDPELAILEAAARKEKIGLWAKPNPIPPWEFRKFGDKTFSGNTLYPANTTDESSDWVWICNTSSSYAYHKHHCSGLKQCKADPVQIPFEVARKAGRKPGGVCWQ